LPNTDANIPAARGLKGRSTLTEMIPGAARLMFELCLVEPVEKFTVDQNVLKVEASLHLR
jgi:hypothetical protein